MKLFNLSKIIKFKIFVIVFVATFIGYLVNLPIDYKISLRTATFRRLLTSYDVTSNTFLPHEIISKKTVYFSQDTVDAMKRVQDPNVYSVIKIKDKYFSAYPILTGIMALPIYLVPILLNKIPDLQYVRDLLKVLVLGRITASFYTAISVAFFYLILKEVNKLKKFKDSKWEVLFIIFYAFGTNIYSIASRSLWQHTSSLLFITLIIYFLLLSIKDEKYIKWIGIFSALLYIARPLNIVFVILLSIFIFVKYKKHFIKYLLLAMPFAILLFSYNYYAFGNAFTTEYMVKGDTKFSTPLIEGAVGNLFSPARSFIFITPPFLAMYLSIFLIIRKKQKDEFDKIMILLSITYLIIFILYSKWWCWYGADRFGYGFFTEWVPIIALLTYLIFKPSVKNVKILFFILMIWSLYTQFNAVWFRKCRCSGVSHNWTFYCLKPLGLLQKQEY